MTTPKPLPSQADLIRLLDYDPSTGLFFLKSGKRALCTNRRGYLIGALNGEKNYFAHRIAWKYVHGVDPIEIGHINGDKADNRIANLRDVTHEVNGRNQKLHNRSATGTPGVYWYRARSIWRAHITADGTDHFLGYFSEKQEAIAARKAAETKFGFHPNHGRAA